MSGQLSPAEAGGTQRRDEGAPLGAPSRHFGRLALPALTTATAALLLGGCSGGPDTVAASESPKPPTVEKLASALRCRADIQRKVEDYRLGVCEVAKSRYTFVTFKDNHAKRGWLDHSKDYGGNYLVGSGWLVVTETPSQLGPIQAKYGGTVERGRNHTGHGS